MGVEVATLGWLFDRGKSAIEAPKRDAEWQARKAEEEQAKQMRQAELRRHTEEQQAAMTAAARQRRAYQGMNKPNDRSGTLLTGPLGVTGQANVGTKTLLGE